MRQGERTIPRATKRLACSCSHEKYGSTLLDVHVRRLATSLELSEPEPSFFFRLLSGHFSIFVSQGLCGMRRPARLYPMSMARIKVWISSRIYFTSRQVPPWLPSLSDEPKPPEELQYVFLISYVRALEIVLNSLHNVAFVSTTITYHDPHKLCNPDFKIHSHARVARTHISRVTNDGLHHPERV